MNFLSEAAPANGKREAEDELMFLCKITDFAELNAAYEVEHQEQWELKSRFNGGALNPGTVRVRAINNKEFILTTKIFKGTTLETEVPTSKDMFEDFKALCPMGQIKKRHKFKIPGFPSMCWEVDVYYKSDGTPVEYCKIDLEIKDPKFDRNNLPPFPIGVTDIITQNRTPAEEEKSRMLFLNHFVVYNDNNMLPLDSRGVR